jgi:hypothetical protein
MPEYEEGSPPGESSESSESTGGLGFLTRTRLPLWVSLLLVVLVIAAFAWKIVAVRQAEGRLETERQQMTAKMQADATALRQHAADLLARSSEADHLLFGNALAWAVRGELLRNNLDQIDQYFAQLVKTQGIQLVVLAGPDGKVLVASDKKYQGGAFGQLFPTDLLNAPQVAIQPGQGDQRLLVLPVMGLNNRLGTVVLRYQADKLTF